MQKKLDILRLLIFLSLVIVAAETKADTPRLFIRGPRSSAMGGASVAVIGKENPFFYNPAVLNYVRGGSLTIFDLRVAINGGVMDQYRFYRDHKYEFEHTDELSDDEEEEFYDELWKQAKKKARFLFEGPLPINYVQHNFGIGLFNQGQVDYQIFEGASLSPILDVSFQGSGLAMLSLSRGFDDILPGHLAAGVSFKYLYKVLTAKTKTVTGLTPDEKFEIFRGGSFGIDLGGLYNVTNNFIVGMALYDVLATRIKWTVENATGLQRPPDDKIEPSLRLGCAYYPAWNVLGLLGDVVLAFDLDQPFDPDITFFKKLYFGGEAVLISILKLRGGFSQGYPTFGFGLDLRILQVDYSFYGEEFGRYAGQIASWNHLMRLKLGF